MNGLEKPYRFTTTKQRMHMLFYIAEYCMANDLPEPFVGRANIDFLREFYDTFGARVSEYEIVRGRLRGELSGLEKAAGAPQMIKGIPVINATNQGLRDAKTEEIRNIDQEEAHMAVLPGKMERLRRFADAIWEDKQGRETLLSSLVYQNVPVIVMKIYAGLLDDLAAATQDDPEKPAAAAPVNEVSPAAGTEPAPQP